VELQEAQATSRNATRISQHQRAADGLPVYDVAAVAAAGEGLVWMWVRWSW
jgi:hypothetical protein